jgi:hypothetical protein
MEGERQQPTLVAGEDTLADVEVRLVGHATVLDQPDAASLLGHEQPAAGVGRGGDRGRRHDAADLVERHLHVGRIGRRRARDRPSRSRRRAAREAAEQREAQAEDGQAARCRGARRPRIRPHGSPLLIHPLIHRGGGAVA